jgi:hypothetical protein
MVMYSMKRVFTEWTFKVHISMGALGIFLLFVYLSSKNVGMGDGLFYEKFSATWKWLILITMYYVYLIEMSGRPVAVFKCVVVP